MTSQEQADLLQALRTANLAAERGRADMPELRQLRRLRGRLRQLLANEQVGNAHPADPAEAEDETPAASATPPC